MVAAGPGFRGLQKSGLFGAAAAAFRALCTLKLASRRFGMNLGATRKSFDFSGLGVTIAVFYRKCKGLGIFWSSQGPGHLSFLVHDRLGFD